MTAPSIPKRRQAMADANRNCRACGVKLVAEIYFCGPCWWLVPPVERSGLYSMHHRGQDTATKLAKICRIIEKKLSRGKAVGPAGSSAEPVRSASNAAAESNQAAIGNEHTPGS